MEPKWSLEASLEGQVEPKLRLEASLEGQVEAKWRLEASLKGQVRPKRRQVALGVRLGAPSWAQEALKRPGRAAQVGVHCPTRRSGAAAVQECPRSAGPLGRTLV